MRILALLACMVMATLAAAGAHAETTVQVIDTWPSGDAVTLHKGQTFYLHLRYTSDQPVNIWARPYFEGQPANAGNNPSRAYPVGSGEALGWFVLSRPDVQVDEVRISAGDGSIDGTHVVATYPVSVTASDEPAHASSPPAWVGTLGAADQAAQRAAEAASMNTPSSAGDDAVFYGFVLAVLGFAIGGIAWPVWALWRWRDGWRVAALVPLVVMGFVVLRIIVDGMRDPTSHNLWPFEIAIWGLAGCGWMLALTLARLLTRAGRAR
jgi:hypothetical protein